VAIVVAVLVVIGFLAGFIPRWHQNNAVRAETVDLATPTVAVVSPKPPPLPAGLTLPAEVKAELEAPIFARTSGYLKRWLVDIGAQRRSRPVAGGDRHPGAGPATRTGPRPTGGIGGRVGVGQDHRRALG
jgi:hypothetical protein